MRAFLLPIKAVAWVVLCFAAFRLDAQTPPTASMTIQVKVPSNTPASDTIWILPGQLFNVFSPHVPMSRVAGTTDRWEATISAPTGTILRYEFALNDDYGKAEAYVPFGSKGYSIGPGLYQEQAPLREVLVQNGATIREAVAQWRDTTALGNTTGTLTGNVRDAAGMPLAGIWVSAGPHQTLTDSSGAFQVYGVPAGPCTITVRSENGEFRASNVAVTIPSNETIVQDLALAAATMFDVTFTITVPSNTPAGAVPRLFGDTYRLGMVELQGINEPDTTRYIGMRPLGGGRWSHTASLGNGMCVNYLYTLGFRIMNYENDNQARLVTRALCVNGPTAVSDTINAWKSSLQVPVTLTAASPTGAQDTLYVTTEGNGGSAPVKMWPTGPGKATYTIYANPNTTLNYRYIRNGDPAIGLEIVGTDRNPPAYRSLVVGPSGASSNDTIVAWRHQMREPALSTVTSGITGPVVSRTSPFQTGISVVDYWRSNWLPLVDPTMARLKSMNAQWVQIPAVWTVTVSDPPKGEFVYNSFPPQDLIAHIRSAKAVGLHVALGSLLYPANFPGPRTQTWFDRFFEQVGSISLFYAQLAQAEGVELFILPNFVFDADSNNDQATRLYINAKWKALIAAIRASGYTGKLTSSSLTFVRPEYDWFGDLDFLGDGWLRPVADSSQDSVQSMYARTVEILSDYYLPIVNRFHKPVIFTIGYYSALSSARQRYVLETSDFALADQISDFLPADPSVPSNYDEQARAYQAVLLAFAATPWVQGAYSFGYAYFDFDSKFFSIRAKTAEQILSQTYKQINESQLNDENQPSNPKLPVVTSVNIPGGYPVISPNTWIEISGRNLAPPAVGANGMTWEGAPEFAIGTMPTQLGGVRVTVNGRPAFVYYVSSKQVNVLTPVDNMTGAVQIVVRTGEASSLPFYVQARAAAPASLLLGGTHYVLATHADYSLVGPTSMSVPGYPFSPARPGETITLWATGFGLPKDGVVSGSASQSGPLLATPGVRIGGVGSAETFAAPVVYAGLVAPGLCQLNIIVPGNVPDGDNRVLWFYQQEQGQTYPPGALIAVQR
jgi:uncharacterized protein (TIGR03437 family)